MVVNGMKFKPTRGRVLLKLEDTSEVMASRDPETSNWMEVVEVGETLDFEPEFSEGDVVYMASIRGKKIIADDGTEYLVSNISAIDLTSRQ